MKEENENMKIMMRILSPYSNQRLLSFADSAQLMTSIVDFFLGRIEEILLNHLSN